MLSWERSRCGWYFGSYWNSRFDCSVQQNITVSDILLQCLADHVIFDPRSFHTFSNCTLMMVVENLTIKRHAMTWLVYKMWLLFKRYDRLNLIPLLMGGLVHYFFAYRGFKMFAVVWCWCCFCFVVLLQYLVAFGAPLGWLIISRRSRVSQWQPVDQLTDWLNGMNRKHSKDRFSVAYYDDGHQAMMCAAALQNLLSSPCTTLSVKKCCTSSHGPSVLWRGHRSWQWLCWWL